MIGTNFGAKDDNIFPFITTSGTSVACTDVTVLVAHNCFTCLAPGTIGQISDVIVYIGVLSANYANVSVSSALKFVLGKFIDRGKRRGERRRKRRG